MRASSAKAKGRRACQELRDLILKAFPEIKPEDIRVTASGSNGEDLQLSNLAAGLFPYAVEVKNQERLNIWQSLLQTSLHSQKTGLEPLLAFRRNHSDMFVAIRVEHFLLLAAAVAAGGGLPHEQKPLAHSPGQDARSARRFGRLQKSNRALATASEDE